ncbi:MAG: Competence protein ComEC, partial [Parcubacteria group bacterium]|nr:Competence protein ComEC [Parcubacteria group bacterium]
MRSIGLYVFIAAYAAAVAAIVLTTSHEVVVLCMLGIVGAAGVISRATRTVVWPALVLAVSGLLIAITRMAFVPAEVPESFRDLFDVPVTLTGTVITLPDVRETSARITVEIKGGTQSTNIIAAVPLFPEVYVGDEVRVQGTLKHPEPFETDGGRTFQYDQFLRKDGVFGTMQPAFANVTGRSANLWLEFLRVLQIIKDTLMKLLTQALPEPESSLAAGLIVGGKQGLGNRLIEDFTTSGMLQIIVLSGYNVMIVANTLMRLLTKVPKRISFGIAVLSILCFVLIAGAGSSALRAGLMAFFATTASTFRRRYDVMRILFVSLFLLGLWNPLMLVYDPGFQFSFIATLGLILGVPVITPRLLFLKNKLLIELVSTTLAAEIALLPFLLWQTGNLSLVSIFANVIAMPAVPFAMGLSALAGMLAFPLGYIASVLPVLAGLPAYLPLAYIIKIATLSASLPFAQVTIPLFSFWIVILTYSLYALLLYRFSKQPHRGIGSPLPASLSSQETPERTASCPLACSQSCRHVPRDQ